MIAFGVAISDQEAFDALALPGIMRAAESDSQILRRKGMSIQAAYNEILDEAAAMPDLEGVVLLHQDLELTDDSAGDRLRRLFRDPHVGLVGPLGARNVTPHLWPAPEGICGTFREPGHDLRLSSGPQRVAVLDGILLALAPWVVRGLRFNMALAKGFHGYDVDLCLRVRAHGGTSLCDDIPYFHHRTATDDYEKQGLAGIALAKMWDPDLRPRQWASAFLQ
jgi:hypothetical protein